jgi:hypothetical protein
MDAEALGDRGDVLGGVGQEQPPGLAESFFTHGVHDTDRGANRSHRPSTPADRSPAIPLMLALFFSALYAFMPSGPFFSA